MASEQLAGIVRLGHAASRSWMHFKRVVFQLRKPQFPGASFLGVLLLVLFPDRAVSPMPVHEVPHGEKWWRYGYEYVFVQCVLMDIVLLTLIMVFGTLASAPLALGTYNQRKQESHGGLQHCQTPFVPHVLRCAPSKAHEKPCNSVIKRNPKHKICGFPNLR